MNRIKYRLKKASIISLSFFTAVIFTSCAQVLSLTAVPVENLFVPTIIKDSEGVKIFCSLSPNISKDIRNSNHTTQDFAVYIWRSTVSPYSDFELLGRVYNPELAVIHTGHDAAGNEIIYDFNLPDDGFNCDYRNFTYLLDEKALETVCYYRITRVEFNKILTVNQLNSTLTYSLEQKTSGWASSRGNHE